MNRWVAVLTTAVLTLTLVSCTVVYGLPEASPPSDKDTPSVSPTATPSPPPPPEAYTNRFPSPGLAPLTLTELTWSDDKETAAGRLRISVAFPQAEDADAINAYYASRLEDLQAMADTFAQWAEGEHTLVSQYQIECNRDGLLSVSHQFRLDDTLSVSAETFSVPAGDRLRLEDLFPTARDTYAHTLCGEVRAQLASGAFPGLYEDAETLVWECFPYDTFCVTPGGISLLYPPQTVAAQPEGLIRFDIPFAAFMDIW